MALQEKTQMSLAHQKANPRPPSSSGRKGGKAVQPKTLLAQNSDDSGSGSNYGDDFNDDPDEEADKKAEKKLLAIRKAMNRENKTASNIVTKHNLQVRKEEGGKPVLKMGPTIKGTVTMEQITKDVANMPADQLIMPQANNPNQLPRKGYQVGQAPLNNK